MVKLFGLDTNKILEKLFEMILDRKLNAILDQGHGYLLIFEDLKVEESYSSVLNVIQNLEKVTDALYEKTNNLRSKAEY